MKVLFENIKDQLERLSPKIADAFPIESDNSQLKCLQAYVEKPLPKDFVDFYENCDGKVEERYGVFAYGMELRDLNNCFRLVKEYDEESNDDEMFELIGRRNVLDYVDPQIDSLVAYSKYSNSDCYSDENGYMY